MLYIIWSQCVLLYEKNTDAQNWKRIQLQSIFLSDRGPVFTLKIPAQQLEPLKMLHFQIQLRLLILNDMNDLPLTALELLWYSIYVNYVEDTQILYGLFNELCVYIGTSLLWKYTRLP